MSIIQNQPFTIITKYVITSTPLWIYIISIIVGILSLVLISYALYRVCFDATKYYFYSIFIYAFLFQFGFFKRGTRDNLVILKRQSELQSYWIVPGDEDEC